MIASETMRPLPVQRYLVHGGRESILDPVVNETTLRLVVDGCEWTTASLLPGHEREFVLGWLRTAGAIRQAGDVRRCEIDLVHGIAAIDLAVPARLDGPPLSPVNSGLRVRCDTILHAIENLLQSSDLFKATGGTHAMAVCDPGGQRLLLREDIGRHNAFDKLVGATLLDPMFEPSKSFVGCTCRLSSEIVLKAWQWGLPLLASQSCVTTRAVSLATAAGITLIGFARNGRLNIYTGPERVMAVEES